MSIKEIPWIRRMLLSGKLTERKVAAHTNPRVFAAYKYSLKVLWKGLKSTFYTVAGFGLLILLWQVVSQLTHKAVPAPAATLTIFWELISNPFYDNGPNDQGIGWLTMYSIGRVGLGFFIGSLIAIPLGILVGAVLPMRKLLYPVINILKPVSPLAWYPIGVAIFLNAPKATIFIIALTSLWPALINTAFGVASIPDDHRNVAKAFGFSRTKFVFKVLLPYALPQMITGLRLSMSVAWLVIVAAEMLGGSPGLGWFVWEGHNSGKLENVICAILFIGLIGLLFDRLFTLIEKSVSYGK